MAQLYCFMTLCQNWVKVVHGGVNDPLLDVPTLKMNV